MECRFRANSNVPPSQAVKPRIPNISPDFELSKLTNLTLTNQFTIFMTIFVNLFIKYNFSDGHAMWGLSTIGLVFVPFFLSIIKHHLVHIRDIKSFKLKTLWTRLRTIGQCSAIAKSLKNFPSWLKKSFTTVPEMKSLEKLPECLLHLPFLQPFNHLRFFIELNNAILKLDEAKMDLREAVLPNDTMSNQEREHAEENITNLEKKVRETKKSVARVQGKFQQTKILEAYGESGPQFCLQLAIMIQIAHISPLQIASVTISIISFTLAASNVYSQMPTKYSEIPYQDWKNNLYIVPAMFFSVLPRLISLSLLMAYLRHWTFLTHRTGPPS
jgi:hypothetical protein